MKSLSIHRPYFGLAVVRSLSMPEHSGDENVIVSSLELILMMMVREGRRTRKSPANQPDCFERGRSERCVTGPDQQKVPSAPSFSAPETTVIRV
jgi:hypothetical protein